MGWAKSPLSPSRGVPLTNFSFFNRNRSDIWLTSMISFKIGTFIFFKNTVNSTNYNSMVADVDLEGRKFGFHTKIVELGLRYGMKLFIVSEVFFFFKVFLSLFHSRLAPNWSVGPCDHQ